MKNLRLACSNLNTPRWFDITLAHHRLWDQLSLMNHDVELKAYLHHHTTHNNGRIRLTAWANSLHFHNYSDSQTTFQHGLPSPRQTNGVIGIWYFGTKVWNLRNFKSQYLANHLRVESQVPTPNQNFCGSELPTSWGMQAYHGKKHTKNFKIEATTVFCNLAFQPFQASSPFTISS